MTETMTKPKRIAKKYKEEVEDLCLDLSASNPSRDREEIFADIKERFASGSHKFRIVDEEMRIFNVEEMQADSLLDSEYIRVDFWTPVEKIGRRKRLEAWEIARFSMLNHIGFYQDEGLVIPKKRLTALLENLPNNQRWLFHKIIFQHKGAVDKNHLLAGIEAQKTFLYQALAGQLITQVIERESRQTAIRIVNNIQGETDDDQAKDKLLKLADFLTIDGKDHFTVKVEVFKELKTQIEAIRNNYSQILAFLTLMKKFDNSFAINAYQQGPEIDIEQILERQEDLLEALRIMSAKLPDPVEVELESGVKMSELLRLANLETAEEATGSAFEREGERYASHITDTVELNKEYNEEDHKAK